MAEETTKLEIELKPAPDSGAEGLQEQIDEIVETLEDEAEESWKTSLAELTRALEQLTAAQAETTARLARLDVVEGALETMRSAIAAMQTTPIPEMPEGPELTPSSEIETAIVEASESENPESADENPESAEAPPRYKIV